MMVYYLANLLIKQIVLRALITKSDMAILTSPGSNIPGDMPGGTVYG